MEMNFTAVGEVLYVIVSDLAISLILGISPGGARWLGARGLGTHFKVIRTNHEYVLWNRFVITTAFVEL